MNTLKNECFAYTRVSTAKQGEGVSLQAQKDAIQAFADRNDLSITQWFEETETAAKSGRPIFSNMMKQLHQRKAGGVIIHKIDRSARNFSDWAKIGELSDSGINVHFAAESLDFKSRGGRLTADIQAVIAADYIRNLREETLKGMRGRLKQGLYPWKAPIGYVDNGGGKAKTIDPVYGPLVRRLFELYASGEHSLRTIIPEAKRIGLRNSRGKPIGKCCIETLLANPFYVGLIHTKKDNKTYQGIHEPLITHRLFQHVADTRAGRSVKKVTRHQFEYRRVFKCKNCQTSMIAERQKGLVYYRCHTQGCTHGTIREENITHAVASIIRSLVISDVSSTEIRKRITVWVEKSPSSKLRNSLAMQQTKIQERKTSLVDALIDGLIDKQTFKERNNELLVQASQLAEQSREKIKSADIPDKAHKILELFKSLYVSYSMANDSEKRQLLEILFSNRFIDGQNVELEPRKWVRQTSNLFGVLYGAPPRTTKRSGHQLGLDAIHHMFDVLNCPEAQSFINIISSANNTKTCVTTQSDASTFGIEPEA